VILQTKEEVFRLQQTIREIQPKLLKQSFENEVLVQDLQVKSDQATQTQMVVKKEQQQA